MRKQAAEALAGRGTNSAPYFQGGEQNLWQYPLTAAESGCRHPGSSGSNEFRCRQEKVPHHSCAFPPACSFLTRTVKIHACAGMERERGQRRQSQIQPRAVQRKFFPSLKQYQKSLEKYRPALCQKEKTQSSANCQVFHF